MTCQATGCQNYALPYPYELDLGDVVVEVRVCYSHERTLCGKLPPAVLQMCAVRR